MFLLTFICLSVVDDNSLMKCLEGLHVTSRN